MKVTCDKCNGRGWRNRLGELGFLEQFWKPHRITCEECGGSGYVSVRYEPPEEAAEEPDEMPDGWLLDGINRYWEWVDDGLVKESQYTETIGLETPFEGVFISDTASGVCMSALQVELKRWEPVLEQWGGNLNRIGKRCYEHVERSFEPLPADRNAAIGNDSTPKGAMNESAPKKSERLETHGGIPVPDEIAEQILKCSQMGSTFIDSDSFASACETLGTSLEGVKEGLRKELDSGPQKRLNGRYEPEERREIDTEFMARGTAVTLRDYLVDWCHMNPLLMPACPRELDGLWVVPGDWVAYKPNHQ